MNDQPQTPTTSTTTQDSTLPFNTFTLPPPHPFTFIIDPDDPPNT